MHECSQNLKHIEGNLYYCVICDKRYWLTHKQPGSPTLASLLTAEEAGEALWCLCCCNYCDCGSDVPECIDNQDITEGVEQVQPPAEAKLCRALWERAKEGK